MDRRWVIGFIWIHVIYAAGKSWYVLKAFETLAHTERRQSYDTWLRGEPQRFSDFAELEKLHGFPIAKWSPFKVDSDIFRWFSWIFMDFPDVSLLKVWHGNFAAQKGAVGTRALYGFQTPGIFMDTHTLAHTLRQLKNGRVMISDVGVSYLR